jgi:succinoglycan biosynthesis protein ExoM
MRGDKAYPALASGNVLIRRAAVTARVRFDPRLGLTGGEDTLYFTQLAADGARLVWCAEAVAWEHIPEERQNWRYVLKRSFRGGQMVSLTPLLLRPKRPALTILSMAIALVQIPALSIAVAAHSATRSQQKYESLVKLASATGRLLWAAPFRAVAYGADC